MKQNKIIYITTSIALCFLALFATFIGLAWDQNAFESPNKSSETTTLNMGKVNDFEFSYEVAETPQSREIGLMNRTSLDKNHGMLFVFEAEDERTFWMKNTFISLDIIFLDKDFKVVYLHTYTQPNQTESLYPSIYPSMYAVEFNAGTALKHNIKVGDKFSFDHN